MPDDSKPEECKSIKNPALGYFTYQKQDSEERGCFPISNDCSL